MTRDPSRHRARRKTGTIPQRPWGEVINPYAPIKVLSDEQIERIHLGGLRILEDIGMKVLSDQALDIFKRAGADVDRDSRRVRLDRGLVLEAVARAPAEFTLHSRNPARDVTFGGRRIAFAPVSGTPNCADLDRGRRPGSFADYCDFLKLAQSLNVMHLMAGYPVEPLDLPVPTRHLDCYRAFVTLTDRAWRASALSRERTLDAIEMNCIARGIDRDGLKAAPGLITMINTNSPLLLDGAMADGVIEMARAGQAVSITPFTLAGAMSPVTLAGALAQQNAEALAGIALAQLAGPGAPVLYGGFTSNVDMKSGAPAFGTPEASFAALAGGQLARRYGLPYRSSNVNSSNAVDAQAAYESEMSIWSAVMGHANLVHHGAGWLEGGLVASFEKMILDAEMLQMMAAFLDPIVVDDDSLAFEAIAEVGPGGHFFGAAHTLARYETAFYSPMVSDWRNFETWQDAGAKDATQRANAVWKQLLAEYQPPPIEPSVVEALDDFVARRKREMGPAAA